MVRIFLLTTVLMLNSLVNTFAQEVTVVGVGIDRNSAIRDATRLAVEQVAGTYIDSRTLMQDLIIQLDEVYKSSRGFVKKIDILEESQVDEETYQVRAKIDVDTDPNSDLINQLTMIMQLNDPRIAVVAFDDNSIRNKQIEGVLTESLLNSGFSHVKDNDTLKIVNPDDVKSKKNATGIDYLVSCRFSKISRPVRIPDHKNHTTKKTSLNNVKTNFRVDVIKCDTGEFIGSFEVDGNGTEDDETLATFNAISETSNKAADKLVDTFKKFSAGTTQNLSFTVIASSNSKIEEFISDLRYISKIDNVYIREISEGSAVLDVDSSQKPYEIIAILKQKSKLGIFIENITNSSCKLRIT